MLILNSLNLANFLFNVFQIFLRCEVRFNCTKSQIQVAISVVDKKSFFSNLLNKNKYLSYFSWANSDQRKPLFINHHHSKHFLPSYEIIHYFVMNKKHHTKKKSFLFVECCRIANGIYVKRSRITLCLSSQNKIFVLRHRHPGNFWNAMHSALSRATCLHFSASTLNHRLF